MDTAGGWKKEKKCWWRRGKKKMVSGPALTFFGWERIDSRGWSRVRKGTGNACVA